MDFEALQKEAHAIAREKGLYDTGRSFSSFIADIHEVLSEAGKTYQPVFPIWLKQVMR